MVRDAQHLLFQCFLSQFWSQVSPIGKGKKGPFRLPRIFSSFSNKRSKVIEALFSSWHIVDKSMICCFRLLLFFFDDDAQSTGYQTPSKCIPYGYDFLWDFFLQILRMSDNGSKNRKVPFSRTAPAADWRVVASKHKLTATTNFPKFEWFVYIW